MQNQTHNVDEMHDYALVELQLVQCEQLIKKHENQLVHLDQERITPKEALQHEQTDKQTIEEVVSNYTLSQLNHSHLYE